MSNSSLDAGIPVLTEIIASPVEEGLSTAADEVEAPPAQEEIAAPGISAAEGITATQLRYVENEVTERVLQQLLGRIDFVLEQRVRDSLADVLQTAVEGLATEIRQGLQQTLEEVVSRAVSQEIARLQTTNDKFYL